MENKRIRKITEKQQAINNAKEEYNEPSAVEKRRITNEKKRASKERKQAEYRERMGEERINEIIRKRKATKELNMEILNKFKIFNKDVKLNSVVNIFKNYSHKNIQQLPVKIKGHNVLQIKVNKNLMTRDDIKRLSQNVSNEMNKLKVSGKMITSLKYNENKFRSGKPSKFGQPVNLYQGVNYDFEDDEDEAQEFFNSFTMYLTEYNTARGGSSNNNNNCFYDCLKEILNGSIPWSDAVAFKKWLKIGVYDKVKLDDMQKIEQYLKVSINITGDFIYNTNINSNKIINLKLIDEHFILDMKQTKEELNNNRKIAFNNKTPIIYDTSNFNAYDGKEQFKLMKEYRNNIYSWTTPYILINSNTDNLKEEYNNFVDDADILLKETNNLINLYKTGNNKTTALNLFYSFNRHIKPDNIRQVEAEYINNSSCGALLYAKAGIYSDVYKYDVCSLYPSIMSSGALFPIKEGELLRITTEDFNNMEFLKFGIYRAIIRGTTNLFKFNDNNYYTHIDIKQAQELNLDVKLIEDDQPNFIYYSRDKLITGSELFGQYVKLLFNLKKKGVKKSKQILNILWGALCETNSKTITINNDDTNIKYIDGNINLLKIKPFNESFTMIEYINNDEQFKSNFARLKPFLLSLGRKKLTNLIKDDINNIIFFHTDGWCGLRPSNIKTGFELGDLKYEGKAEKLEIIHINKIIGEFKI